MAAKKIKNKQIEGKDSQLTVTDGQRYEEYETQRPESFVSLSPCDPSFMHVSVFFGSPFC